MEQRAEHKLKKDATKHFITRPLITHTPPRDSKMSNNSSTKSIPVRRVQIHDAHQMPSRYSETPGGTIFSTTPGGIHYLTSIFLMFFLIKTSELWYYMKWLFLILWGISFSNTLYCHFSSLDICFSYPVCRYCGTQVDKIYFLKTSTTTLVTNSKIWRQIMTDFFYLKNFCFPPRL